MPKNEVFIFTRLVSYDTVWHHNNGNLTFSISNLEIEN